MGVGMKQNDQYRFPFSPFPIGWHFLEFSEKLKSGQLHSKEWLGQERVYWRDAAGKVCLSNSVCPHLGANLAPQFGAKLDKDLLVCPFHGLKYNTDGQCVYSPIGKELTNSAFLSTFPIRETGGMIFAYWHPDGLEPTWSVPDLEGGDYSKFQYSENQIRSHPQETTENVVDMTHLPLVHGYQNVQSSGSPEIVGHQMFNQFKITKVIGPNKFFNMKLHLNVKVSLWGATYSMIEADMADAGLAIRQLALCTPIDGHRVSFVMALQMKDIDRPNVLMPGLSLIPRKLLTAILVRIFARCYYSDVAQDFAIWENKQYLTHPRLATSERAIFIYRRYCEQFYKTISTKSSLETLEVSQT